MKAAELWMVAPTPEAEVFTSTYFYDLRFSWDLWEKKREKNKERPKYGEIASGETNAVLVYCRS